MSFAVAMFRRCTLDAIRMDARLRGWLAVAVMLWSAAFPAAALDRDMTIAQFHHTTWTSGDGAPTDVWAVAQTRDGWLWFGAPTGLYRFDGVHFEHVDLKQTPADRSEGVSSLYAAESGELLVGFYRGGISVLRDGVFHRDRDDPALAGATVFALTRDADGNVWVGARDRLLRFDGHHWERIASDWGFPPGMAWALFTDRSGVVWASTPGQVLSLARGSHRFETRLTVSGTAELAESPDGRVWATSSSVDDLQVLPGAPQSASGSCSANSRGSFVSLFDRDGSFWTLTPEGLARIAYPERLGDASHLRSLRRRASALDAFALRGAKTLMEDCEGNIWVPTTTALHRFRRSAIARLTGSITPTYVRGFVAAQDGSTWLAALASTAGSWPGDGLWHFDGSLHHVEAARIAAAMAACEAPNRIVWVAATDGLWRRDGSGFVPDHRFPGDLSTPNLSAMACDADGSVWVSVLGVGLFRRTEMAWKQNGDAVGLPQEGPISMASGRDGRLWLGYRDGAVWTLQHGHAATLAQAGELHIGAVAAVSDQRQLLIGGEFGLGVWQNSRFLQLKADVSSALANITGIVETSEGDVWANGRLGLVHIAAKSLDEAVSNQSGQVAVEIFDADDGYPGVGAPPGSSSSLAKASDGRIWICGGEGTGWIDPDRIERNIVPPHVLIRWLTSDTGRLETNGATMKLAPGTRNLRIDYTGLSFTQPERQQFRYRLTGFDEQWVAAGGRREAFYTNLPPGQYRFEVLAANESGVWSPAPAAVQFEIAPTFVQTRTFLALCVVLSAALLASLMSWRLRQLAGRERSRLEGLMRERERIARELHDTLLQSNQALILQVQAAARKMPEDSPARDELEQALDRADEVMDEGRERVAGLRSVGQTLDDLSLVTQALGMELVQGPAVFRSRVEGDERSLQSNAANEACNIVREALLNAFRHANASSVEVVLTYGSDALRIVVRDDGRGINFAELKAGGRPGHWGLPGMRERAERLGASFAVRSVPGSGTSIELEIPAHLAYLRKPAFIWRWRRRRGQ